MNEIRTVDTVRESENEWSATVTTSNLFDDSVAAVRWELVIAQLGVGSFAVVSGQWSQACQPDRGHQEYSTELCI